jgi:hypothetical protein
MQHSTYLTKEDVRAMLKFIEAFPESSERVTITSESGSGIGSVVSVSLDTVINRYKVKVSIDLIDEDSW